ncbi:MAG: PilZ domain-containing protein [Sulfurihydrogenibium sp.]
MEGNILKFMEEISKNKRGEFYIFYEEVPAKVLLNILNIDFLREQIEFEINPKIEAMISQEKQIYAKYKDEVFVLRAIIWNRENLITSFPKFAVEPKINREYVRVKCSNKKPVSLEIENIKLCVTLRDISERGFSFKLPKEIHIEVGEDYSGKITINDKTFPLKFKVLYKTERPDNTYRYGAKFVEIKPIVENEIAKYITERQREIAKILNTFAD